MIRYVVANLIAGILRPIVWATLRVLALAFVITVPARLWVLYVDPRAGAGVITSLNWASGVLLLGVWLAPRALPVLGRIVAGLRRRRGSRPPARGVGQPMVSRRTIGAR